MFFVVHIESRLVFEFVFNLCLICVDNSGKNLLILAKFC